MRTTFRLRENEFASVSVHPGEHILDELRARKMKQKDLAELAGISNTILNEIIKGKRKISIPFAFKLEKVFGISAETWLNLQRLYDKQQTYQKTSELLSRMKIPKKRHLSLIKAAFQ